MTPPTSWPMPRNFRNFNSPMSTVDHLARLGRPSALAVKQILGLLIPVGVRCWNWRPITTPARQVNSTMCQLGRRFSSISISYCRMRLALRGRMAFAWCGTALSCSNSAPVKLVSGNRSASTWQALQRAIILDCAEEDGLGVRRLFLLGIHPVSNQVEELQEKPVC